MTEQNKTTTIPLPVQGKDMDSIMQSLESGVEERYAATGCHTCYQLQKLAVHG